MAIRHCDLRSHSEDDRARLQDRSLPSLDFKPVTRTPTYSTHRISFKAASTSSHPYQGGAPLFQRMLPTTHSPRRKLRLNIAKTVA